MTDENGIVMEADGTPRYDREKRVTSWKTEDAKAYSQGSDSFATRYQKLYAEYHTRFNTVAWCGYTAEKQEETETEQGESVRQLWNLGNGSQVLVQVTKICSRMEKQATAMISAGITRRRGLWSVMIPPMGFTGLIIYR
ncbi:MAG: hypothetical protein ACLR8P_03970 [Clostridium fessum]